MDDLDKNTRKQVPLRLSLKLFKELTGWANDDFRSLNGQIEFLLTECVNNRKRTQRIKNAGQEDSET